MYALAAILLVICSAFAGIGTTRLVAANVDAQVDRQMNALQWPTPTPAGAVYPAPVGGGAADSAPIAVGGGQIDPATGMWSGPGCGPDESEDACAARFQAVRSEQQIWAETQVKALEIQAGSYEKGLELAGDAVDAMESVNEQTAGVGKTGIVQVGQTAADGYKAMVKIGAMSTISAALPWVVLALVVIAIGGMIGKVASRRSK